MTGGGRQRDEAEPFAGERDGLDELLGSARWPAPTSDDARRLEAMWRDARRHERVRWRIRFSAVAGGALAAGLALALVLNWEGDDGADRAIPVVSEVGRAVADSQSPTPEVVVAHGIRVREANAYERFLVRPREGAASRESQAAEVPRDRAVLERPESPLERIDRVLAEVASTRSEPVLAALMRDEEPAIREAATTAMIGLMDDGRLSEWARREPDPAIQGRVLAALLERGSPDAIGAYLDLHADDRFGVAARNALMNVAHPPLESLFGMLDARRAWRREAAACVLGRLADSETLERLMWMAERGAHRREALTALVCNGSEQAAAFLNRAERSGGMGGTIRSIRIQMHETG